MRVSMKVRRLAATSILGVSTLFSPLSNDSSVLHSPLESKLFAHSSFSNMTFGGYIARIDTFKTRDAVVLEVSGVDVAYNRRLVGSKSGTQVDVDFARHSPEVFAQLLGTKITHGAPLHQFPQNVAQRQRLYASVADKYGLDKDFFMRFGAVESKFFDYAISESGAKGLNQLMPVNYKDVNPFDVEKNTELAGKFLSDVRSKYGIDDPVLLAVSYNAGPGNVLKALREAKAQGVDISDPFNVVNVKSPDGGFVLTRQAREYPIKHRMYGDLIQWCRESKYVQNADSLLLKYNSLRDSYGL